MSEVEEWIIICTQQRNKIDELESQLASLREKAAAMEILEKYGRIEADDPFLIYILTGNTRLSFGKFNAIDILTAARELGIIGEQK
jgi:hypothetical protein